MGSKVRKIFTEIQFPPQRHLLRPENAKIGIQNKRNLRGDTIPIIDGIEIFTKSLMSAILSSFPNNLSCQKYVFALRSPCYIMLCHSSTKVRKRSFFSCFSPYCGSTKALFKSIRYFSLYLSTARFTVSSNAVRRHPLCSKSISSFCRYTALSLHVARRQLFLTTFTYIAYATMIKRMIAIHGVQIIRKILLAAEPFHYLVGIQSGNDFILI